MFTLGKKDGERQYCQKRYLLWNLQDLLNILNGKEVAGSTAGVETFVDWFEKPLSFSLLYTFIRNHKQFVITRTFCKDRTSVRYVKILVFLPKASTNVSKVWIFELIHMKLSRRIVVIPPMMIVCLVLVCFVPVQINSMEMMKKSPQMTLTILILFVGRLMMTKSPTGNRVG